MLLLTTLLSSALGAGLPGLPLNFDLDAEDRWVLPEALPAEFASAGVQPGWVLIAVDGQVFDDPAAARAQVASGPARLVQLTFETDEGDVVVQVQRAPFAHATEVGLLPWPDGFSAPAVRWHRTDQGQPQAVDASSVAWSLDPTTGAWVRAGEPTDPAAAAGVSPVWWALSTADWVISGEDGVRVVAPDRAAKRFGEAARVRAFQGESVEHLLVPETGGLAVWSVERPRGTRGLPDCVPSLPETCLVAGRAVVAELSDLPGATDEAARMLGVACERGVYRACLDAVSLATPSLAAGAASCATQDANACHDVARERLRQRPDATDRVTTGLLEFACAVDASGSLGERLRRLEDVGEGCMLLSAAFDRAGTHDRALLSLDQACVLGRADACDEATRRRDEAFALRTVQECEDPALPLASACVQLGRLLQVRPVEKTELDEFSAFLRGCSLGDEQGCIELGDYVDRWGIEHVRVKSAEKQLADACDAGEQRACIGAGHLFVRHDPKSDAYAEALTLFTGACDAGLSSGCIAGAEQRRIGKAKQVDAPAPVALWGAACDQASAVGCLGLGDRLVRSKKTWPETYTAWTRSCDIGAAHACTELGRLVIERHSPAWPDEQAPDAYLRQGCENGDAEGCYWLAADDVPKKGDPPEPAYLLLEQSCSGEFGPACAELADVHLDRKTSFDNEIAAGHLLSACDNAHFESCKELGQMYIKGKGVEKDRVRAKELLQKFSVNAQRRHVRLGLHFGFPYVAGGELELVAPIPVGPAIAVTGSYSYLPRLGGALMQLKGETAPGDPPDLQYADAGVRLYPNNKARGLYAMVGAHWMQAEGGDLVDHELLEPVLTRVGPSARLGIHSENKALYTRVEMGIGSYGMIDLVDFDEDETGSFPLIQATLGLSVGFAPF
jgi:TPR repeat protein